MSKWVEYAKTTMFETEGTHDCRWVNTKSLIAIAYALIAIAEELEKRDGEREKGGDVR